ncbi:PREDICTED: uncharacterized protein LOC108574538 [Habropoda laboriosa]|uniref:uncharacterized protein LOC108574538 n=1 Tax=Habropoda laboriosa TaxID=597456 RepID=UPI00083E0348|nr:PREDICTED: uncharacterized protein LOC108574538 [Habropoda laboriosa]
MSLVIFFMCLQEYVKIVIKIWNTMAYKYSPHVLYFIFLGRNLKKDSISGKNIRNCDDANLHTKLTVKFENCKEHLRTKLNRDDKDVYTLEKNKNFNELNTNIYIIQNEIIFNSYTLLLSNNYELYQYFSNQQLKNNLMHKYLLDQSCAYIKNDLKSSNNYKRSDDGPPKKYIQKRIVSSSPEFQKFLANLRKPQFFNPCISGVSARYIIRIKSTYK